jgi:hypothetical protein
VSIAFSIDNPVKEDHPSTDSDKRLNEVKKTRKLTGIVMSNPGLPADDPMHGTFAMAVMPTDDTEVTHWRGWPQSAWWNSPLLFWDAFGADGQLSSEPEAYNSVAAISQQRSIASGQSATFIFLLAWHFPNRTPDWCGWASPPGKGKTVIGNFYATRFKDAWDAAEYPAENLDQLGDVHAFSPRRFVTALYRLQSKMPLALTSPRLHPPPVFAQPTASFTALKEATTESVVVTATALMSGTMRPSPRSYFHPLLDHCAKPLSATRSTIREPSELDKSFPTTSPATTSPRWMAIWDRSCMPILTGSSPATPHGYAQCGLVLKRPWSFAGSREVGTQRKSA